MGVASHWSRTGGEVVKRASISFKAYLIDALSSKFQNPVTNDQEDEEGAAHDQSLTPNCILVSKYRVTKGRG